MRGGGENTAKNNNCAITSEETAFFPKHLDVQFEKKLFQLPVRKTMGSSGHGLLIYISANHLAAFSAFATKGECHLQSISTNTICIMLGKQVIFQCYTM